LFNSNPAIKHTAIVVASMWRETLGIETELIDEEYRVFLQSRHDRSRWDVARLAWSADFNDASNFLDTLRAHSSNNDPGYTNAAFDNLLDAAAANADSARRRELLESSERLMLTDYPIVPLYFLVSKRLIKPYVQGVVTSTLNASAIAGRPPCVCLAHRVRDPRPVLVGDYRISSVAPIDAPFS
jgi:ABC-type oligopeptide transport system substrate-binding subunit